MHEPIVELRMDCLRFAAQSNVPAHEIPDLAARFLAFALHAHPEPAEYQHKLDILAKALHDLAHVIREDGEHTRKELRIMSANSDAAAAAALTLAASVDAALAAGIGTGGAIPPDVAADAAALPVATQAMTDQAARLTAATPAPVV